MKTLLTHFDANKTDLGRRIAAAPSIEDVVNLTDGYLSRLHRETAGKFSLHKSRNAGYLLEVLRYAIRTLNSVDKEIFMDELRPLGARNGLASNRFFFFGKAIQIALFLALLTTLFSTHPVPWISILLAIIFLGTEIYLDAFAWRTLSESRKNSGFQKPAERPHIAVQVKITQIHSFLNCVADALSYIDKALSDQTSEKEGGCLEKETQILRLFQDLFEAKAFHDGDWALKKIPRIQAILWEQGITVKEFDPQAPADILSFDTEPGGDPSIRHHVTIRPALIKGNRTLLRGRVAEPFSSTPAHKNEF